MPVIVVTSRDQGAGKTGVAAAVARRIAYQGRPVRLLRVAGEGDVNAEADAQYFSSLEFVPGSPDKPMSAADIANPRVGTYVVETTLADAAQISATRSVLVSRDRAPDRIPDGLTANLVVVTAVSGPPQTRPKTVGSVPVVYLPDDRRLAGFSMSEARAALNADLLVEGDIADPTCDQLVVAPISSDAGQPYLLRFENPAVVCRFDRTDMHLAAIRSNPSCLILTGGHRPSDYLFDAARSQGVPVLLSWTDTENTIMALEDVFEHTRFQGDLKLNRLSELLEATGSLEGLDEEAAAGQP